MENLLWNRQSGFQESFGKENNILILEFTLDG